MIDDPLLKELAPHLSPELVAALRARLERAERLAHVGRLAAGVAHELRNPLAVIETSVYIVKNASTEPRVLKHAERIGEQVSIASAIVNELLDAARDRPLDAAEVDLASLCEEAIAWVPKRPETVLGLALPRGEGRVWGDARRLRQVLINLVSNAVEAVRGERVPKVEVRVTAEAGWAVVEVRDHGKGIAPDLLPRLFEPLVTSREEGTGLGLALARDIALAHQGTLTADNAADGGARFVLRLPLLENTPRPQPSDAP